MTLIDIDYEEFVAKAVEMPPDILRELAEALEDRLKGLEAAIVASKQKDDRGAEVRLLMSLAWNSRKLAALKALLAESRWKYAQGG